jgi:hypothetical protein
MSPGRHSLFLIAVELGTLYMLSGTKVYPGKSNIGVILWQLNLTLQL